MKIEWHRFDKAWPEPDRELWVWGGRVTNKVPAIVDSIDSRGWGWISEHDHDLDVTRDKPTHWAYAERPDPPEVEDE